MSTHTGLLEIDPDVLAAVFPASDPTITSAPSDRIESMANPRLASNLDELLAAFLPDEAIVERFAGRYDILFQKRNARLLLCISLESQTYEVGGNAPVAARSLADVVDASVLFALVRGFLGAIAPLGVTEARR